MRLCTVLTVAAVCLAQTIALGQTPTGGTQTPSPVRPGVTPTQSAPQPTTGTTPSPTRPGGTPTQGSLQTTTGTTLPLSITNPLFQNADVRRELTLTDAQFNRLNTSHGLMRTQFMDQFGKLGPLAEQQRAQRLRELETNFGSNFMRSASDVLNEQQIGRLRQLELQNRGFNAFTDAGIQKQLNLSAEQIQGIQKLGSEVGTREQEILRAANANPQQAQQLLGELRQQTLNRTNALLNDQQRQAWSQMTGTQFQFRPVLPPQGTALPRQ